MNTFFINNYQQDKQPFRWFGRRPKNPPLQRSHCLPSTFSLHSHWSVLQSKTWYKNVNVIVSIYPSVHDLLCYYYWFTYWARMFSNCHYNDNKIVHRAEVLFSKSTIRIYNVVFEDWSSQSELCQAQCQHTSKHIFFNKCYLMQYFRDNRF